MLTSRATAGARRRIRRSPKRVLLLCHRWVSLLLGSLVVVLSTSGALVVYAPELLRAANPTLFHGTPSDQPIGFQRAIDAVQRVDDEFRPTEVSLKDGVYGVSGSDGDGTAYFVDAGNGHVNGRANVNGGVVGFLVNLHDCALSCAGYAGYLAPLTAPSVLAGWAPFEGVTWGALLIAVTGLALVVVTVTAPFIWWPGIRRWRRGFRLRWNRGPYARHLDLHNVIGIVAVVPLLVWSLTGLNFEVPGFRTLWDAVTGSEPPPTAEDGVLTPTNEPGPAVTLQSALDVAQRAFPGGVPSFVVMPSEDAAYFLIDLVDGGPNLWAHNVTYEGNRSVAVDAHDAANSRIVLGVPATVANAVIDEWAQPALHYGIAVNPYWRVLWFVLGLTPLALMLTGTSTWLRRRRVQRRRLRAIPGDVS